MPVKSSNCSTNGVHGQSRCISFRSFRTRHREQNPTPKAATRSAFVLQSCRGNSSALRTIRWQGTYFFGEIPNFPSAQSGRRTGRLFPRGLRELRPLSEELNLPFFPSLCSLHCSSLFLHLPLILPTFYLTLSIYRILCDATKDATSRL